MMATAGALMAAAPAPASAAGTAPGAPPAPGLSVSAAALIEESTGQQLYASNADQQLPIASTTKLMTALLTLEHVHRLDRTFGQNDYYPSAVDAQIGLVAGERMSVHDLLLATLLPSAADAAEDLAYNVGGGSVDYFIGMMNARARELGLTNTHYSTPVGVDTPGNYSSANDLLSLTRLLLRQHPFFAYAVSLPAATLNTGSYVRHVVNRNDLVGRIWWINGVKTGHTAAAGYVLVGSGTWRGMTLISVVLGTSSPAARDANTVALLGYGFDNFRLVDPITPRAVLARLPVHGQPGLRERVIAAHGFTQVILRNARLTTRLELPHMVKGPLPRHTVVGTAIVSASGHLLARVPLLVADRVPAPRSVSSLTLAARFISRPTTLVALALLLACFTGLALWLTLRRRERPARPDATGPEPA
jgi:D-alanyl-D-alanine carboxypeptidase (penicillin-binding protein 5/6)